MKIAKAPELLKKAATMCKSKTGILATRLLVQASLRCSIATIGAFSHRIHTLAVAADLKKSAMMDCHKTLVMRKVEKTLVNHGGESVVNLSHQLALFDQENDGDSGCTDWTLHPIFNGDDTNFCYTDECDVDGEVEGNEDDDDVLLDVCDEDDNDEPPVMDVIRNDKRLKVWSSTLTTRSIRRPICSSLGFGSA